MGIYGAMLTAVTGLNAQSYALENISGNIANSQTPGFKRVETSFEDMIPDTPLNRQAAGSVAAFSRSTNTIAGDITDTGIKTNLAISGSGFFVVRDRTAYSGGEPVFNGQDLYTRRGDFKLDANGYLVNGPGNYLMGLTIDPATGAVNGASPSPIKISTQQISAKATTTIKYVGNLPAVPASGLMNTTVYDATTNPNGFNSAASGKVNTIEAGESARFESQSLAGPSIAVYDSLGTPITLQTRWAKTKNAGVGSSDTWSLYYQSNPSASGAATKWSRIGDYAFDAKGALTTVTAAAGAVPTIPATTIGGANIGPIAFDVSGGLTQSSDISGQLKSSFLSQDGYSAGVPQDVSINQDGVVSISYSNQQVLPVYQVAMARFNAADALKRMDGGTFAQTLESGVPLTGLGTAKLQSGRLEGSNSDIADQFSKMIVTQQAYSANTRVITTSQQMLQEMLGIVR